MGNKIIDNHLPGDIYLTRNPVVDKDDSLNPSPGFWNHLAIYVGNNIIVEGQGPPHNKVIKFDLEKFRNRYPMWEHLRFFNSVKAAEAAQYALELVGTPYWLKSSIRFRQKVWKGVNCVSAVRIPYIYATGQDLKWHFPDAIKKDKRFYVVESKNDTNFLPVKDFWDGLIE